MVEITPNTTELILLQFKWTRLTRDFKSFKENLKPRWRKPPGHYLCTPEPGRLDCVMSISKGVNGDAYPVAVSQKVTKTLHVSFYSHTPGFKDDEQLAITEAQYNFIAAKCVYSITLQCNGAYRQENKKPKKTLPFWHFCWCRGFCHRTGSDILLFVFITQLSNEPGTISKCVQFFQT